MERMRLQKYLARCGICSRRRAEEHIAAGRVRVDGRVVTTMGVIVGRENRVSFNGREIHPEEEFEYYLLNKPAGWVTTLRDPQGRPTVTSLLSGVTTRIFPVGRLDIDTEGALILTNDGTLAQRIQHPSQHTSKSYQALVKGHPSPATLRRLQRGVEIDGRRTAPARARLLEKNDHSALIELILHEGRKRQVKKMCAATGHPVLHLKRTAYGRLGLGDLKKGEWKRLAPSELEKIFLHPAKPGKSPARHNTR